MKAADDAQVGPTIMHHDISDVMMPDQQLDRLVPLTAESRVDTLGEILDLLGAAI
jgi:hypothetical protein